MFRVGAFSKIARVSKRLLHHYDHIGLFQPCHVAEDTGYRFYSVNQLPELNRILALRDLGLSLEQITQLVQKGVSNEEIRGMLLMRKAEVEQDLLASQRRLRGIEARLQHNETAEAPLDIVVKAIPEQGFLATSARLATLEDGLRLTTEIVTEVPRQVGAGVLGPFLCIVHGDAFRLEDNAVELGFVLNKAVAAPVVLGDGLVLQPKTLAAVPTMATSYQSGGPDPIIAAFGQIARWIEANHYCMAGPYRELFFDFGLGADPNGIVVELQVPVAKNESPPRQS
ncbi:MerR family transcriptional regulator [Acanthopleuribacter pedis]|nr:MerR family transcriptional regulator [Acanthopleuribacter pedis]